MYGGGDERPDEPRLELYGGGDGCVVRPGERREKDMAGACWGACLPRKRVVNRAHSDLCQL